MEPIPLLEIFIKRINRLGPIRLDHYITQALLHPHYGYYTNHDPLGASGDFITAPEISQIFGEMIGVWCGAIWHIIGQPSALTLVELGPGRATLLLDIVRVLRALPKMPDVLSLELVEVSPVLRAIQQQTLNQAGWSATWYRSLAELPDQGPKLIIANEFLDTLPCRQFIFTPSGLKEHYITVNHDHKLESIFLPAHIPIDLLPIESRLEDKPLKEGQIVEFSLAQQAYIADIGQRIASYGGASLLIDYGYYDKLPIRGSLRAFRHHQQVHPLEAPGITDLSFAVNFKAAKATVNAAVPHAKAYGPLCQGRWLQTLGFNARMNQLAAKIENPTSRRRFLCAAQQLIHPCDMGSRFKVLAIAPKGIDGLPGFERSEVVLQKARQVRETKQG